MRGRGPIWGALRIAEAARLLRRERSLWPLCLLPLALTVLLFALALALFFGFAYEPLHENLAAALSSADPTAWYEWLWVGPLRLLAWAVRWLLILAVLFAVFFGFTLVGSVIASPFLDALSARVEQLRTGDVQSGASGVLRGTLRVMWEELKRTAFFLFGQLLLLALALIPGLQVPVAVAAVLFAAFFLCLDYSAYLLDRREVAFRTRRAWLWQHKAPAAGFGLAALGTFLIPGLNFAALPVLVTAGTLLALDLAPPPTPALPRS